MFLFFFFLPTHSLLFGEKTVTLWLASLVRQFPATTGSQELPDFIQLECQSLTFTGLGSRVKENGLIESILSSGFLSGHKSPLSYCWVIKFINPLETDEKEGKENKTRHFFFVPKIKTRVRETFQPSSPKGLEH